MEMTLLTQTESLSNYPTGGLLWKPSLCIDRGLRDLISNTRVGPEALWREIEKKTCSTRCLSIVDVQRNGFVNVCALHQLIRADRKRTRQAPAHILTRD